MYIKINNIEYTEINDLSFAPEADLLNDSLPINEFEAKVFTNNYIAFGQWADLYDDENHLYAHYWLRFAERIGRDDDRQTYIVSIIGQSPLAFLERVTMPAEMVDDDAWVLIMDILDYLGSMGHDGDIISGNDIDNEVGDVHITGFCPEQSARERLQWILTAAGGYALSAFNDVIAINKVPLGSNESATLIPAEKTFWKPTISYRDYVSSIKVTGYTFTEGTPSNVDEYVTDGTTYWIQQKQVISVSNPSLPSGAPNNEIIIDGLTILTPSRASIVASILANYYFNRVEVEADVIDNCEYEPGMKVMVYTDIDTIYGGYIKSCNFSFGLQSKSTIHLIGTYNVDIATLTVEYRWDNKLVKSIIYYLPKDTTYSITTEYIDFIDGGYRYVFRPDIELITGTLNSNETVVVSIQIALKYYNSKSEDLANIKKQIAILQKDLNNTYKKEAASISKAYKGKKNKKQREKYLKKLADLRSKDLKKIEKALKILYERNPEYISILHILSVDNVSEEDQELTEEGTVVVIDED